MNEDDFTVIDDGRISQVAAAAEHASVRLSPAALHTALGWDVKPQGLCKGDRCVPTSDHPDLATADGIDLGRFAQLLSRPIATDIEERVAYIGVAAADRAAQLTSLEAPDFTLPDLDGTLHSLSDYVGRKLLLVAYASW